MIWLRKVDTRDDDPAFPEEDELGMRWDIAVAELVLVRGTPYADVCGRMLVHVAAGWRMVRHLGSASGASTETGEADDRHGDLRTLPPAAVEKSLVAYANLEVVDAYRWLATSFAEYVTGYKDSTTPTLDDLAGETERMVQAFSVLLLAACHPAVPEDYRECVERASGLGTWHAEFSARFERFAELMDARTETPSNIA